MKISWLSTVAGAAVLGTVIRAVYFTPLEAKQGAAQKIYYIHVPSAWVAFLAFFLVAVASAVYLWLRDPRLDRFAESSAEVGVVSGTWLACGSVAFGCAASSKSRMTDSVES